MGLKHKGKIISVGVILLLLLIVIFAQASDRTYQGKVIDAETKEPIEGAVVVAIWRQSKGTMTGPRTRFKDSKETLTDKNGEWSIVGPEGYENKMISGFLHIMGVFVTESPVFIIYKPGYRTRNMPGYFAAYPYVDRKHSIEGIVLVRPGDTRDDITEFRKKYGNSLPFIPVREPERKLSALDFSFEYSKDFRKVGWQRGIEPFKVFTVIGLKKANTRQERLEALQSILKEGSQPILEGLMKEERTLLGL